MLHMMGKLNSNTIEHTMGFLCSDNLAVFSMPIGIDPMQKWLPLYYSLVRI